MKLCLLGKRDGYRLRHTLLSLFTFKNRRTLKGFSYKKIKRWRKDNAFVEFFKKMAALVGNDKTLMGAVIDFEENWSLDSGWALKFKSMKLFIIH